LKADTATRHRLFRHPADERRQPRRSGRHRRGCWRWRLLTIVGSYGSSRG